ncbi:5-methylcytosine-specific restriction endonuclease McrA [Ereboglobus sp. PH5-5]|uniref:HNH endonuclease n=1 Tax=Ereboglobus sp. PH5-5 TaxID=2940529 RepID=UPI0024077427|nr:HNH endonuclease [Ereboglobus sp. PH5-5]MDF9832793.1 5-methylcytosine-specific restriction endonuclease McrA [Ereboglobus sp. PH5-5]
MTPLLDKPLVLSLNRSWQVIGHRTVRQALVALNGGDPSAASALPPALGIDIAYEQHADGTWDFSQPLYLNPLAWDDWLALPVRDFDLTVNTPRQAVRVPTVMIATNYAKMPVRMPRLTREAIYERDGGVCQYTGEYVGRGNGNLDHIVPRSRGGRDTFENLVWAKREINSLKADRLPHEAGLRLLRRPQTPRPLPASALVREARHPDWRHFITASA